MHDYATKCYGRSSDVASIYKLLEAGHDISMPGPRRLGKTFVLDRMVDVASEKGWVAVKVEVAGCTDTRAFFRQLCSRIGTKRSGGKQAVAWFLQRLGQVVEPRSDTSGTWYQGLISLDHESYFERLIKAMNDDPKNRWVLLVDELPIFLKALHDKGNEGVIAARNFMNLSSRLRVDYPRVRWMITGSIGLEPLAHAGNYMGVLAKFKNYDLQPLNETQALEFVKDLAATGRLMSRSAITDIEAQTLVNAVGWRSAYYLDALAQKLSGDPSEDATQAAILIEDAVVRLLQSTESATFGVWEEHLRKHYQDPDRATAFTVLWALAPYPQGSGLDTLLAAVGQPDVTIPKLLSVLTRLEVEGFVTITNRDSDHPSAAFRNLLLRRWWSRYKPQATA